jgi:hypothetical protein
MRHIDNERLERLEAWPPGKHPHQKLSPEKWHERLSLAEKELRSASSSEERSKIMTRYSNLWSEAKVHLRDLSHDKCWYCETSTHRMRGDIDHHRPKARVFGTNHPGYWWLAFNWRNWRFACTNCNSQLTDGVSGRVGGKGDYFPLMNGEDSRISTECEYEDLLCEEPLLLDPVEPGDIGLLTFTRDGLPAPSEATPAEGAEEPPGYRRAKTSIVLYHLDHSSLVKKRQEIYADVKQLVLDYQRYQKKWEESRDPSAYALAKRAATKLGRMIAPDAEYSMTARAYLKEYRKSEAEWDWVDKLLTAS